MKLAVVGATGMVGNVMLEVLKERNFPYDELILVASERSKGKQLSYNNKSYTLYGLQEAVDAKPDIAIFSAGGSVSKEWAPKFAASGTTVIDNSSAWRMDSDKKLVVPEINANELTKDDKIIANPNCSTIQMVLALLPIHKNFGIERLVISTYQSVTGTGVAAVKQLEDERSGKQPTMVYPHPIDKNCLPHGGDFDDNGYTSEEMKLVNETRKILGDETIQITATVVRVPVIGGHSEAVNVQTRKDFSLKEVRALLEATPGIEVQDDPANNIYPMPITAHHKDEVLVGRIRKDLSVPHGLDLWIVADNLRKGAATNAIQIAEYVLSKKLV
ncbi:aspartate-semialdehyde dehydrogenase [Parvicella tangerina]|uniref:Aspartate-semialdehyde dehydrogenase n=1 Tax=Parvicella tangerina TaxID=2829795 RepID=A0A916NK29_9FLAO|nr:aspartate-semialdehyde dehydrogenase [Parvicella tangerina]CAG5086859.1 Aspartate-semialdehyde dehydrogenase 2 [Parvicella tangerina]